MGTNKNTKCCLYFLLHLVFIFCIFTLKFAFILDFFNEKKDMKKLLKWTLSRSWRNVKEKVCALYRKQLCMVWGASVDCGGPGGTLEGPGVDTVRLLLTDFFICQNCYESLEIRRSRNSSQYISSVCYSVCQGVLGEGWFGGVWSFQIHMKNI